MRMSDKKQTVVSGEFAVEKFDRNDDFIKSRIFTVRGDEMDELVTNCDRFRSVRHSSVPMSAFSEHGRRYCAVSKMDTMFIPSIMERI